MAQNSINTHGEKAGALSTALRNGKNVSPNVGRSENSSFALGLGTSSGILSTDDRTNDSTPGSGSWAPCNDDANAKKSYTQKLITKKRIMKQQKSINSMIKRNSTINPKNIKLI